MAEPTTGVTPPAGGSIASDAYDVAKSSDDTRASIMADIKSQMITNQTNGTDVAALKIDLQGTKDVDITTGAGALLLDDTLQKLGTQEQVAGQILSSSNRSTKEMQSTLRA